MTQDFPDTFDFSGFNEPTRLEAEVYDLVVEGEIPAEIDGTWYRLTPEPQYPPMLGHDTYLSGDGLLSMFRFKDGHVDYKSRYVRTDRLKAEREARRGLFGLYRNPYTDDPSVAGINRTVANTTPVWHGNRLMCLKEDGLPYEVDPETLETKGQWNYNGRLKSETMTAHTWTDPDTGELFFYGYEAGGLATRDIAFCVADKDGNLIREEWFEAPYCALMHDFVVTKEHVIFPVFPTTADFDRIKNGGAHWVWEPDKPSYIGIMPRDGSVKDLRWFTGPPVMAFHFMNGVSEGNKVHMDFGYAKVAQFPFIREASGVEFNPEDMQQPYVRWTFDLSKNADTFEEYPLAPGGDFPRVAAKDHMKDYDIGYYQTYDPDNGAPLTAGPVGVGFNTVCRLEIKSGNRKTFSAGPGTTVQEHIHIPSREPGHEGYLCFVTDLHESFGSEVTLLEAENPEKGPLARIKMPHRLRNQVHGNWVPAEAF